MLDTLNSLISYQHKGVIFLDQSRRVLSKNQIADSLINKAYDLRIHKGLVTSTNSQQDKNFKSALRSVLSKLLPTTIFFRDSNILHPLRLDILPIYDDFIVNDEIASVMILIETYEPSEIVVPNQFGDFYCLTKVERVVVELLAQGMTPKECADYRGRSVSTIRWTLRNIFNKTNTNSQKELFTITSLFTS